MSQPIEASRSPLIETGVVSSPKDAIFSLFEKYHLEMSHKDFPPPSLMVHIIDKALKGSFKTAISLPTPNPKAIFLSKIDLLSKKFLCASFDRRVLPDAKKNDKGYFKRPILGEGGFSKVYEATLLELSFDTGIFEEKAIAVSKTRAHIFNKTAYDLLAEVPEHPCLLARPISFYGLGKGHKSVYITMPLLKEKADILTVLESSKDQKEKFKLFLTSCSYVAKAADHLHKMAVIHGDIRMENMGLDGLFDYSSLHREGFCLGCGAPWDEVAPEHVLYYAPFIKEEGRKKQLIQKTIAMFEGWYGAESLKELSTSIPSLTFEEHGYLLIPYTKAGDVFTLGMQFTRYFGEGIHPSLWSFATSPSKAALRDFVIRMLSINASERPSMEECAAFFETHLLKI